MWTFDGIRIIATEKEGDHEQIIASLNPLGGGTINQIFGYADEVAKITCVVVGDTDKEALITRSTTGLAYTLSGSEGVVGSFLLKRFTHVRKPIYRQTLREDLDPYSPVYWCNLDLLKE